MGETTKERRDEIRAATVDYPAAKHTATVGLLVSLLDDADRCEELEKDNAFLVDRRMVLSAHYEQHTARIAELEAEVHQRDEWLERAKARYEGLAFTLDGAEEARNHLAKVNEQLRAGIQRAADGCRREAKIHGFGGAKLTAAYAAATARHLDSLLPSKGDG